MAHARSNGRRFGSRAAALAAESGRDGTNPDGSAQDATGGKGESSTGEADGDSDKGPAWREDGDTTVGRRSLTGDVNRMASFAWDVLKEAVGMGGSEDGPTATGTTAGDYPWVEYSVGGGEMRYRNKVTGAVQEAKPEGFDKYGRSLEVDTETMALAVVDQPKTRWDRYRALLSDSPLMRAWSAASEAVASSDAARRVSEAREDLQTQWETSQNPLVYRAASALDAVVGETEQGRAVARIQELDPRFDGGPAFLEECRSTIIPSLVSAMLRGDRVELDGWCTDDCMARINAVLRAREAEALTVDATILSTSDVNIASAKVLETGPPIVMVTGMVQQLHCIRDKHGKVVEGSEDEIRAVVYALGLQRMYVPEKGGLVWQVCELSYTGGQLYL